MRAIQHIKPTRRGRLQRPSLAAAMLPKSPQIRFGELDSLKSAMRKTSMTKTKKALDMAVN
jgi:hypothetical protein